MRKTQDRGRVLNRSTSGPGGTARTKRTSGVTATGRRSGRGEAESRLRQEKEHVEAVFGFEKVESSVPRLGWLLNYLPTVS